MDSASLLNQLTTYDQGRKNSVDVLNEAMGKYGVPEIRNRVAGLRTSLTNTENSLNAVDPSVTGRTQGSLVTEAQRQRQVSNERAPILQDYSKLSGALGNESQNLTDQERAAQTLAEGSINDWNAGRSALQDRYNATYQREQDANSLALERAKLAAAQSQYQFNPSGTPAAAGGGGNPNDALASSAIANVAGRQGASKAELLSDYNATLMSANNGNQFDKYKVDAYKRLFPWIFQPDAAPGKSYNIFTDQGAKNASSAIKSKASAITGALTSKLKSNAKVFGF